MKRKILCIGLISIFILSTFTSASALFIKNEKLVFKFSEGYKQFLDSAKTEREAVDVILEMVKENNFKSENSMQTILNSTNKE